MRIALSSSKRLPQMSSRSVGRSRTRFCVRAAQKQTFGSFDDVIKSSELPVLVDFYATWCGPCVALSPILSSLSSKLKDKVKIVKVDTDKYPVIASRYGVQALPTLILFKNGSPVDRIEGLLQERQLQDRLTRFLG